MTALLVGANGGVLFLDETHNLPRRVQKSLLRVLEDSHLARIGETEETKIDVKFVFASNEKAPKYGLVKDMLPRLTRLRVKGSDTTPCNFV